MYQGKFNQKNKKEAVDIQELLAQRNAAARRPEPLKTPPRRETPGAPRNPAPKSQPTEKRPAPQQNTAPAKKSRKQAPRPGGVIFYTVYFLFILVFFAATYLGMSWLNGWLVDLQASQPDVQAQRVFDQIFTDPDWEALYVSAGVKDTVFEGKEAYAAYMRQRMEGKELTYLETSAGLSGGKKYLIRLDGKKVASFTLVDKNKVGEASLENLNEIPDWQLSAVEVFFTRDNSYRISSVDGHVVKVNGVELNESHVIQIATTLATDYLPVGVKGFSMVTSEVTGLFVQPTVEIFDEDGNSAEVTYDEDTRTFTERTESNTIPASEKEFVISAAETQCLWMIEEIKDRTKVAKFFDPSGEAYKSIVGTNELFAQKNRGYEFKDVVVSNYERYNDDLFSVRITLTLSVTRTDGTIRDFAYAKSMFFRKNDKDRWLCTIAVNTDLTQPVGRVLLTFKQGDTVLTSDFFRTDADEIITPLVSAPEGKVFGGWVRETVNEAGDTVLELVFLPDESQHVIIPDHVRLEPMTLYPLFEDAAEGGN